MQNFIGLDVWHVMLGILVWHKTTSLEAQLNKILPNNGLDNSRIK